MSHSYKKRSRRNRPYHSYTYRSREYRLRQYRKRRMRRRLLFSLGVLLLLFIGSHVISIYASKGHADRNEQNKPPGAPDVKGQEDSSEVYNPSDTTLVKEDSHTQEVSSDHQTEPDGGGFKEPDTPDTKEGQNTDSQKDESSHTKPEDSAGSEEDPKNSSSDTSSLDDTQTDTSQEDDTQTSPPDNDDNKADVPKEDETQQPPEEAEFNFENALFIGDSRTEGLFINTGLSEATFYAIRGLNVENIYTKDFIKDKTILAEKEKEEGATKKKKKKNKKKKEDSEDEDSGGVTILEALKYHSWRKIYIMLGVNELGWAYESVFIERYTNLIRDIRALQPDAEIVIQSILPVTKEKSDSDDIYNNKRIARYNELIEAMAKEEQVTYADLTPAVSGKNGALPKKGSSDGIHLTKSYYIKWLDYLIAHEI